MSGGTFDIALIRYTSGNANNINYPRQCAMYAKCNRRKRLAARARNRFRALIKEERNLRARISKGDASYLELAARSLARGNVKSEQRPRLGPRWSPSCGRQTGKRAAVFRKKRDNVWNNAGH